MEKKVLLIADDDDMNRVIIRKFLQSSFEILEAEDGEMALEMIEKHHVDALLLDIIMPKLDGMEVLKQLRASGKAEQIGILVATSTKERTEREALSLGADDIVSKPYDPVVIKKRMENIILLKEVQQKNKWIAENDTDALMHQKIAEIEKVVEEASEKIRKIADIIESNKENEKLLTEMTHEIHQEVSRMMDTFARYK